MNDRRPVRIKLEIGELALRGFAPEHRQQVADQFQRSLAGLLADPAMVAGLNRNAALPALSLSLPSTSEPTLVGAQAAKLIIRGLPR